MQVSTFAIAWIFVSYVIYSYVSTILFERSLEKERKRRGIRKPRQAVADLPFGIDHVYRALRADKQRTFPDYVEDRFKKFGMTHEYRVLGCRGISTYDPKIVQALLATQFRDFELGPRRRGIFSPLLGAGIFTDDGRKWEHSRAMLRPQFVREQVSDLKLEEEHVQNMMRCMRVDGSGWTAPTDLSTIFFRLTLDSACQFLFGESVDSQLQRDPSFQAEFASSGKKRAHDPNGFATSFDRAQAMLASRSRFVDKYFLMDSLRFRKDCRIVHNFIDHFVELAISNYQKSKAAGADEKDVEAGRKPRYVFLDALVQETQDPLELRSQLLNILLAGRDTTASLLGWTFWELGRHPELYERLRQEVLQAFGPYSDDPHQRISFTSLKGCQYLQHTLNESLRVHPVVPFNFRSAVRDTVLPRGGGPDGSEPMVIRKGDQVEYTVHLMHRAEEFWGPDAKEFKPERWVGRKPGWEYLPFNGGPRICLGQQFALTEASYVMVRLLQRFDRLDNLNNNPMTHNLTLTSCPGEGVMMRLHEAEKL